MPIFTKYQVTWEFCDNLCASVPADPDLISKWLETRMPRVIPPNSKTMAEIQQEIATTLMEPVEDTYSLLVFQRIDGHLVVRAATVRAHIKDCARVLSAQYIGKIKGERSFATRVINGVYHDESQYWLPILDRESQPVTSPDGTKQKPIHARGPTGQPLNALKEFETVRQPMLRFTLKVLGKSVSLEDLETLFEYGGCHGYGGERGDGEGRYTFEIKEAEE